jgi:hypothetical protein
MTDRELMQMALDALESVRTTVALTKNFNMKWYDHPIKSLRDRLAQPDREWVGLTDEDFREAFNTAYDGEDFELIGDFSWFAELIEAKLKEKNGG